MTIRNHKVPRILGLNGQPLRSDDRKQIIIAKKIERIGLWIREAVADLAPGWVRKVIDRWPRAGRILLALFRVNALFSPPTWNPDDDDYCFILRRGRVVAQTRFKWKAE